MKQKTIIVTGIGGVVGQGVLRNISDFDRSIRIIGVNIAEVSAGNYLCDKVIKVPYSYDAEYIPAISKIVKEEKVDLIIPTTDYESFYLAKNESSLGVSVASSPSYVTEFCLDKYKNFKAFKEHNIPFAESFLPSEYRGIFDKVIVKPREGRGSRNIHVNPDAPQAFDDSYLVQKYLEGPEITTSFYVKKNGALHGFITFERELELGNTAKCEVVDKYDDELRLLIQKMIIAFPFRGSCNIQSRITSAGIIPFEINCRISGTNSVRTQFGFKDVQYTVEEYLFGVEPSAPVITKGSALRVILDIIYPEKSLRDISDKNDNFYIH
jgi:carbamoyl-phosphate synthase large subunit